MRLDGIMTQVVIMVDRVQSSKERNMAIETTVANAGNNPEVLM